MQSVSVVVKWLVFNTSGNPLLGFPSDTFVKILSQSTITTVRNNNYMMFYDHFGISVDNMQYLSFSSQLGWLDIDEQIEHCILPGEYIKIRSKWTL